MDCKDVREFVSDLEADKLSPELLDHVTRCSGCKMYLDNARLVKAGFRALAEETVPEASLGFASRMVRRLEEWGGKPSRSEFFETVGQRFVYAASALVLALLLALVLPPSGPVRGISSADFVGMQADIRSSQFDIMGRDVIDLQDLDTQRLSK
jgi:hypothetical protein